MRTRPVLDVPCAGCRRICFVRRLRGPWRGLVQIIDGQGAHLTVQLPREGDRYSLAGFLCRRCRQHAEKEGSCASSSAAHVP